MIAIAARSRLSPQPPAVNSAGYTINYVPDASEHACSITAHATDGANNVISGSASSSALGVYHGPATTSLTGVGMIRLQRTCSWTLHNPFDTMSVTYQSTASVAVTWEH